MQLDIHELPHMLAARRANLESRIDLHELGKRVMAQWAMIGE
jgi:hypothetical protein